MAGRPSMSTDSATAATTEWISAFMRFLPPAKTFVMSVWRLASAVRKNARRQGGERPTATTTDYEELRGEGLRGSVGRLEHREWDVSERDRGDAGNGRENL